MREPGGLPGRRPPVPVRGGGDGDLLPGGIHRWVVELIIPIAFGVMSVRVVTRATNPILAHFGPHDAPPPAVLASAPPLTRLQQIRRVIICAGVGLLALAALGVGLGFLAQPFFAMAGGLAGAATMGVAEVVLARTVLAWRRPPAGLLAEAAQVLRQLGDRRELGVGVELAGAGQQGRLFLAALGVGDAALDGAYRLAGLVVVEADALGAEVGVDHIGVVTRTARGALPCGACRQLLAEYAPDATVFVADSAALPKIRKFTVAKLLPGAFRGDALR